MMKEHLAIKNCQGNTAFFLASASGKVESAKVMLKKKEELAYIRGEYEKLLPIHIAAQRGHRHMVNYLYDVTKDRLTEEDCTELLPFLISKADLFGK